MIADKIKNARTIKKLIQEQVAEDLNVSRQTISNWENGKSLPDIVSIIRMSELYDLSLDELLKGNATLLNKIEAIAFEKEAILTTDIQQNLVIAGNKEMLERMAETLLENAIRHTEAGKEVKIVLKKDEKKVQLSMEN